jgi:L-xylulokinase
MGGYYLGMDSGGTVVKAVLYDHEGRQVAGSGSNCGLELPRPGWVERDPDHLWSANAEAIKKLIQQSGIDPVQIRAVATTGHGNGLYLVDQDGQAVYPGIYSTDSRALSYVQNWYGGGTYERVHPKILQSIWPGQPVALLAWFLDHKPEVLDRTRWVLLCKDYLRLRLTGQALAEITDFSGSSLMNSRDKCLDPELLEAYGLGGLMDKLPPLTGSTSLCGAVTAEAAAATGLREGTPVAGGLFDIDACAVATGVTDPALLSIVAGTWSINQYVSPEPVVNRDLFMTSRYCIEDTWLITEASATSGSNLEWFVQNFLEAEGERAAREGGSVYEVANQMLAKTSADESQIIFLPFCTPPMWVPRPRQPWSA